MGKQILIKCHVLQTRESEYDAQHIPGASSSSVLVDYLCNA